jgi:hypothetical protein
MARGEPLLDTRINADHTAFKARHYRVAIIHEMAAGSARFTCRTLPHEKTFTGFLIRVPEIRSENKFTDAR